MCGLTGLFLPTSAPPQKLNMDPMLDIMRHRGPDGDGRYVSPDQRFQAGFRRLSIIDLNNSDQPIISDDKTRVLLGNGEIYNYKELRNTPETANYAYKTHGDMEVILPLHEQFGENFVDHLNGMFALAIYQTDRHHLTLVRDRLGIKPLYWAKTASGGIIFASEIKSILASGLIAPPIHEPAVAQYLAHGYIPAPMTLFQGIHKLQPGHTLSVNATGDITSQRYWRARPSTSQFTTVQNQHHHLLDLLKDSLNLRLRSDVPLGVLLSGGIDSGLLVALASSIIDRPLNTYTVRFEGAAYDESPLAQQVANRYDTDHHLIDLPVTGIGAELVAMAWHLEEPLNDAALLPNFMIERALGRDVRVALNGTGGDELFAGYRRYFKRPVEQRYTQLPQWLRGSVLEPLINTIAPMRAWQLARAEKFDQNRGDYIFDHTTYFPNAIMDQLQSPLTLPSSAHGQAFNDFHGGAQTGGLIADIETYLPEDLLLLLDRSSMAASVEGRVPFLDHRLVEAALAVPAHQRTPGNQQKGLLKKLAADYLPDDVLAAPKQGFASPVPSWMRSGLATTARQLLTRPETLDRGWWTKNGIETLLQNPDRDGFRIYSLVMLELSIRLFTEMPLSSSPPTVSLEAFSGG